MTKRTSASAVPRAPTPSHKWLLIQGAVLDEQFPGNDFRWVSLPTTQLALGSALAEALEAEYVDDNIRRQIQATQDSVLGVDRGQSVEQRFLGVRIYVIDASDEEDIVLRAQKDLLTGHQILSFRAVMPEQLEQTVVDLTAACIAVQLTVLVEAQPRMGEGLIFPMLRS